MIGTEHFFPDRERALDQRLGLGVAALNLVDLAEIVQQRRHRRMLRAGGLLVDRQGALEQRFGIAVPALFFV